MNIEETVRELERPGIRWVWDSTRTWYPRMLAAGVTVERCHDVALSREILRHSPSCAGTEYGNRLQSRPDEAEDAKAELAALRAHDAEGHRRAAHAVADVEAQRGETDQVRREV